MSKMIKAKYFQETIYFTQIQTRFGALETDQPKLYDDGLRNGKVVKVDCLEALRGKIDDNLLNNMRSEVYAVVSGTSSIKTNEEYRALFQFMYVNFETFRDTVDTAFIFRKDGYNLISAFVKLVRGIIEEYTEKILEISKKTGGSLLMQTHDYVILYYREKEPPEFDKAVVIV